MDRIHSDCKWGLIMINSDWNSFRTNPKFFESYRNLYPNQKVLFRSNPKLVFNSNQSEVLQNQCEWNRINQNKSELLIRMNPLYPN